MSTSHDQQRQVCAEQTTPVQVTRGGPTHRQLEFLACVEAQTRLRGSVPSYREIGRLLNIRSGNGVCEFVERLVALGLLEHAPYRKRALHVTDAGREALDARRWRFLEIVDGRAVPA